MKPSIPILLYHHVAPEGPISPAAFEAQLRFLQERGWTALAIDDVIRMVGGQKEVPARAFALTFDDGYRDNWTEAFPVLQRLSMRAVIYLVTERIGTPEFLTWPDIEAMADSGLVTFGSHTHTHRHFIRGERYQDLEQELGQSKALIEERLGKLCQDLAWPWGDYETGWLPLVKHIGYRSAATVSSGANTLGKDPYALKRIPVRRPDLDWFRRRLFRNQWAVPAALLGPFNGLDRRFKVWWHHETPYAHG